MKTIIPRQRGLENPHIHAADPAQGGGRVSAY